MAIDPLIWIVMSKLVFSSFMNKCSNDLSKTVSPIIIQNREYWAWEIGFDRWTIDADTEKICAKNSSWRKKTWNVAGFCFNGRENVLFKYCNAYEAVLSNRFRGNFINVEWDSIIVLE